MIIKISEVIWNLKKYLSRFIRNQQHFLYFVHLMCRLFYVAFQLSLKFQAMMNFYDVISPIHFLSKFSGLTIFSLNCKSSTTRFSYLDFLFMISTIVINFILNEYFWSNFILISYYQSQIIQTSLPFLYYGKYLIHVLTIVWGIVMRSRISELVKAIQDVDEMVCDYS